MTVTIDFPDPGSDANPIGKDLVFEIDEQYSLTFAHQPVGQIAFQGTLSAIATRVAGIDNEEQTRINPGAQVHTITISLQSFAGSGRWGETDGSKWDGGNAGPEDKLTIFDAALSEFTIGSAQGRVTLDAAGYGESFNALGVAPLEPTLSFSASSERESPQTFSADLQFVEISDLDKVVSATARGPE